MQIQLCRVQARQKEKSIIREKKYIASGAGSRFHRFSTVFVVRQKVGWIAQKLHPPFVRNLAADFLLHAGDVGSSWQAVLQKDRGGADIALLRHIQKPEGKRLDVLFRDGGAENGQILPRCRRPSHSRPVARLKSALYVSPG